MAERKAAEREAAPLDSAELLKRNEALMAKLKTGTATRADGAKLTATMDAIEARKTEADAIRKSMSQAELIKRNEALMAKVKAGTATRADVEKAAIVTGAIEKRSATLTSIAKETDIAALMKRNADLMKPLAKGTATRADEEAIKAVMKRKEEMDEELKAERARETAAKLTRARAELRLTMRKTEVRDVMNMVKESERFGLCFMVDATGSMASYIEQVKTQVTKIATDVQRTNPHLSLRVGFVGYRDALDGDGATRCLTSLTALSNSSPAWALSPRTAAATDVRTSRAASATCFRCRGSTRLAFSSSSPTRHPTAAGTTTVATTTTPRATMAFPASCIGSRA